MNRNVDRAAKTGGRAWQAVLRGRRQGASGKEQAASGKRQAASGKRQAASGKRPDWLRKAAAWGVFVTRFFPYIWDLILYFEIFQALI
ncbi:hypothetical protein ACOTF1_02280 [Achromobacter ruhlandii]|uniref:hypothetical protein n=1 Tax=Achromobacter ruhlandii TaxID=72557 RepID=UPI003B9BD3FB